MNTLRYFSFVLLLFASSLQAHVRSPFNGITVSDSAGDYSIIVSGHFHGSSQNLSTFPASTVLAAVDTLNALNPRFLMHLGDLFIDVDDEYVQHYQRSLFSKLKMPFINAVGNHDLAGGKYESLFGKTFFSFRHGSELFVVLNTELNDGSIEGEQLEMLRTAFSSAEVKNVLIFSHRPVWAESNERYKNLFLDNTRSFGRNNFQSDVLPLLRSAAASKKIYWFSGSLGGGAPASFFYDQPQKNLSFVQTAVRDLPRDAVLQIVFHNGNIQFHPISVTGQQLKPLESYDLAFWKLQRGAVEGFNYRMLPYYCKQALTHWYFWSGFIAAAVLLLLFSIFRRWRQRK